MLFLVSAKLMGLKRSPPPFLSLINGTSNLKKKHIIRGVNFASGGSGLLDITGQSLVSPLSHVYIVTYYIRASLRSNNVLYMMCVEHGKKTPESCHLDRADQPI